MRNIFFVSLLIFLLGLIISGFFYLSFSSGNISFYIIAKTVPKYPNSTSWNVSAGTGWPDSSPSSEILFKTNDKAQSVVSFYRQELPKEGWVEESYADEVSITYASFIKNFGNKRFVLNVSKDNSLINKQVRGSITIHEK